MSTLEFGKTGTNGGQYVMASEDNPLPVRTTNASGVAAPLGSRTAGSDGVSNTQGQTLSDGVNQTNFLMAWPYAFNGTSWDRQRSNYDTAALVTHTAASAGVSSADQTNYNARGVKVVVDITAITGTTPTLTVEIQGKDAASGKYYLILTSVALSAIGTTALEVYPSGSSVANVKSNSPLPRQWRVVTTIGGTTPSVTATLGASVIL